MKKILFTLLTSTMIANSVEYGIASFYGVRCNGGTHTASGKRLNNNELTAAHKTYRFGTKLKVTNLSNGKSVIVTITDRGPYMKGRIIDVTPAAAKQLDFVKKGITKVKVELINTTK